jgi:succinate dehydrogenase/fumarate reductase flavoprotein subunit
LSVDLLIAGGGLAGLAAAARATDLGLSVMLVEKGDAVGGSAALSAGIVWTAPDLHTARRVAPEGDPALQRALVEGFEPAVQRVRDLGVAVSERWSGQMGFGVAYHVDMPSLLAALRARAGAVRLRTAVRELCAGGARLDDGTEVHAGAVLLATGGFQGDPDLVKTFIGPHADAMPVRSNPGSAGDGLRIGRAAGASLSGCLGRFYGHLIPDRIDGFGPDRYLPLTQYHSRHAILVNLDGRRFTDESLGDETSNQLLVRQRDGRGVLLCDGRVRREHAVGEPYPHGQVVDRFAAAAEAGARLVSAGALEELVQAVGAWGVDTAELARTVAGSAVLRKPPFHALAVAPCITFTFGGLRVDADGRVLDADGRWVRNLYAAGADAGGLQGPGYLGGLVLGLVFGPRAADAIAAGSARARGSR